MDEQQETPKKKSGSMILIVIGVLFIIVSAVMWLASSQKSKSPAQTETQTTREQEQSEASPTAVSEQPTSNEATTEQTITVEGGNFFFKPNEIRVKKGETVTITFSTKGGVHDFLIDEFNVKSEQIINSSTTVTFTPDKTGTFEYYCSVGNHRQMGMKGSLIVE